MFGDQTSGGYGSTGEKEQNHPGLDFMQFQVGYFPDLYFSQTEDAVSTCGCNA